MSGEQASAQCVVVGAGFSGLAAATHLDDAGSEVLVLEARDRVGGRAWTVGLDDGLALDLGAQWIGATHKRLLGFGEQHGARTFAQYADGLAIISVGGKTVRMRGRIPFGLGPVNLGALAVPLLALDLMARHVDPHEPWAAAKAARRDGQTLESWIARNVRTAAARAICRTVLTGILAADPGEVSLLHALAYINSGGGLESLTGTIGAAQDACFVDGMQGLAERIAERLEGRVRSTQPVRRIRQDGEGAVVETDSLRVECERVIVAVPPTLAGRVEYSPALPAARDQLTQRMPQGSAIKCIAVYDEPFWRAQGWSGLVLDGEGPVSMVIDGSGPRASRGILIGFLEGRAARLAAASGPDARRQAVLRCFAGHFGPRGLRPGEYFDQDWSTEPFTRGCYAGFFPPGAWTAHGRALREPVGRIHWAGTETAVEWMGYVEGALQAGERAAFEALETLR